MRRSLSPRVECLGLMLLALLLIGAGLGLRVPQNVDEERFLGVALEMLHNGSWLIPHRAAEIYGDKPPVFMWTVAFFAWLTGKPSIALYIPGLLSAVTVTAAVYDLGRRLWNQRIGRIAALLYLATYQTYSILQTGQIDSFLVLFTSVGMYGLARHLLLGPAWRWFYVGCAAMGIGVITKGVGFLPALMLIPYAYAVRKDWSGVVAMPGEKRKWLLGFLIMLGAIAIWLLPLALSIVLNGGAEELAYAREILLRQTAGRYAASWDHREPFWYFFTNVIPQYWLPLVLALPWLVPAWRKQLRKHDGRMLVLLGWVALVVLFLHQRRQTQVVHLSGAARVGAGGCTVDSLVAQTLVQPAPAWSTGIQGTGRDLVCAMDRPRFHRADQGRSQSACRDHGAGSDPDRWRRAGTGQLARRPLALRPPADRAFRYGRLYGRAGRSMAARTPSGLRIGSGRVAEPVFQPSDRP